MPIGALSVSVQALHHAARVIGQRVHVFRRKAHGTVRRKHKTKVIERRLHPNLIHFAQGIGLRQRICGFKYRIVHLIVGRIKPLRKFCRQFPNARHVLFVARRLKITRRLLVPHAQYHLAIVAGIVITPETSQRRDRIKTHHAFALVIVFGHLHAVTVTLRFPVLPTAVRNCTESRNHE